MIKKIQIILMLLLANVLNAQVDVATRELLIKLTLFKESLASEEKVDNITLDNFLKIGLKIDVLKQEGFQDFEFYSIDPRIEVRDATIDKLPIIRANCDEFIVAINKESLDVYRLKRVLF